MSKSGINFNIKDTRKLSRANRVIIGNISDSAKETIYNNLLSFLYEEVSPLVPREVKPRFNKKFGTVAELSTNAKITVTKDTPTEYEVYVHFGSDKISRHYARIQHEAEDYEHIIGQYQFLQEPFMEMYPDLINEVQDAIKGVL